MDSIVKMHLKKQNQLQEQVKKLLSEKLMLQEQICVLNECLSIEKIKLKISDLEKKEKMLASMEKIINNLKADIKPLGYLKQLLQRELMVSDENYFNIEERKDSSSSQITVNSGCAIETLDSLSDVSSDESIMVLSEYDIVSDEDIKNNSEKCVSNKVLYEEALLMASSVHSLSIESSSSEIKPIPNKFEQIIDTDGCLQYSSIDCKSCKSEQLLDMFDVVNKQELLNYYENDGVKTEFNLGKSESVTHENHQSCVTSKVLEDGDDVIQLINNEPDNFFVCQNVENLCTKVDPVDAPTICIVNEQLTDISQAIAAASLEEDHMLPEVNTEVENCVQQDQLSNCQFKLQDTNNLKKISSHSSIHENDNLVCLPDISRNEMEINLSNNEGLNVLKDYDDLLAKTNVKLVSININKKSSQPSHNSEFNISNLNVELLKGICQHGFQNLMTWQLQYISHCIDGRDIIFHSYPCIGKTTMCLISVLQRINTSLNECQAVVLVPTLELALFAQKTIKSLGEFLNVSTCIGGANVPRKVSPVPHVVISTPHSLCDMINCNSLCKKFIKMLMLDDADEMFKSKGFFNIIREVLLFLNNDRQIMVLSTSKLEEILDQFSGVMQDPEHIILPDEKPLLNDILQYYVHVPEDWKYDALCELYDALNLSHTVVYCDSWSRSLWLAEKMRLKTHAVSAVYNEMDTSQRRLILRQFRSGSSLLLVTNGLLRGEDFSDVMWVINYNLPKNPKDYVRRIVGCFSRRVKVINFITTNEIPFKENIQTAFNVNMLCIPQSVTDLRASNTDSINDSVYSLLGL